MSFKECREKRGIKANWVAEQMGVTPTMVWLWENGKNVPDARKLPKLARLYGCTVDQLLKGEAVEK